MAILVIAGLVGGATVVVVKGIISALGFGKAGVAAGSIAAVIHSLIGNVAGGSVFSVLQSIGAVGLSWVSQATLAAIGGLLAWLF